MELSIIIPFVNELDKIKHTIRSYRQVFSKSEIIVVQNNSPFPTLDLGVRMENLRIINIGTCEGKGEAIIRGIKIAKYDVVGFTDADGSLSADEFKKLIDTYEKFPTNIVTGNRKMEGAYVHDATFIRRFSSLVYNTLVRILFRTGINDHQCGIKILNRKMFYELGEFKFKDFSFDTELVIKALEHNYRIIPQPIICYDSKESTVKFKHWIKMLLNIIELKKSRLINFRGWIF